MNKIILFLSIFSLTACHTTHPKSPPPGEKLLSDADKFFVIANIDVKCVEQIGGDSVEFCYCITEATKDNMEKFSIDTKESLSRHKQQVLPNDKQLVMCLKQINR